MKPKDRSYMEEKILDWRGFYKRLFVEDRKWEDTKNCTHSLFKNNSGSVEFIKPDFFLDDGHDGFDKVKSIDGSLEISSLHFFMSVLSDEDGLNKGWTENYSSKAICNSTFEGWLEAHLGCYFMPDNESWCAIYVDDQPQDFVVFGANPELICKLKLVIPPDDFL